MEGYIDLITMFTWVERSSLSYFAKNFYGYDFLAGWLPAFQES